MTNRRWLCICAACLVLAGRAAAQPDQAASQAINNLERFERQIEQFYRDTRLAVDRDVPVDQRMLLEYGGAVSFGFLALDDSGQETHLLRQSTLTGYAHVSFDGVHDFLVRGSTTYRDFNAGDDFDGRGDDWVEPTLDRAVYRFDLKQCLAAYEGKPIEGNIIVQGGRQLIHWANGLTLSQEIDGGQITLVQDPFMLSVIGGTTRPSSNDIDTSRPRFDTDTHRVFYGGILSARAGERHRPFVYALFQDDNNPDEGLTAVDAATGLPVSVRFNYDSHYIGVGAEGSLGDRTRYGLEVVYEGGGRSDALTVAGVPIGKTDEEIRAWAFDVSLVHMLTDQNNTRLGAELIVASGDSSRGTTLDSLAAATPGTKDTAFNGFGLQDTGLAFSPSASNLVLLRCGASTFPLPRSGLFDKLQVGGNVFFYNKLRSDGPIDEPTSDDRYLGLGTDVFLNWQISSDVALSTHYGIFFPGKAIETDNDCRHFLFAGLTYAF